MNLGAPEIGLIVLAVFLLFGYKKLPDASRSLGRSLRIFKGEMGGMADDAKSAAPVAAAVPDLEAAARAAEAEALEARARAARARADAQRPQIPA